MLDKPTELRCGTSLNKTAARILKTPNFKGDARRIKKGVFVPPLSTDSLIHIGDHSITGPATHGILLFFQHTAVHFRPWTIFFVYLYPMLRRNKQQEEIIPS